MLVQTLAKNPAFLDMPITDQEIYLRLADEFQSDNQYLYCSPEELQEKSGIGTVEQWRFFLALTPVKDYINAQMALITEIAQRKALLNLQMAAESGNVTAIKEINELSGIMNRIQNNRVVVLHRVNRRSLDDTANAN